MISKFLSYKNKFYILFLFFFSIIVNYYYASKGVFPIDTFLHFDSGYRILNGEYPFVDFWTVSGPVINYIQAIFFYLLGINWSSYILHASLMNALLTISTFFLLKNFQLKNDFCFFYSFLFALLAYPSSGTPFLDHHSAFFSLMGIYSLLNGIKNKKAIYWLLIPIFFGFAFLSKQVPAFYIILAVSIITILYSIKNKTLIYINYFAASSAFFILCVLFLGKLQGISFSSFFEQYIFYPQSIGYERLSNFDFSFRGVVDHFKFIYLSIIPFLILNLKKIFFSQKYIKTDEFYIFLIIIFLTFCLIFHQLLTKNQTFIFFLIPILTAFSHISLNDFKVKKYNSLIYGTIIFICLFASFKYHLRFNEERKFHELTNVNFEQSISAHRIHKKLTGLKWITPEFKNEVEKEIDIINDIKSKLQTDKRNKMLLTNYTFFSAILDQKLFSPSWAFADDGTTHPVNGNKYVEKYKGLMINIIKKNKILVIYIAGSLDDSHIYNYIDESCFKKKIISENLKSYEIKKCNEING